MVVVLARSLLYSVMRCDLDVMSNISIHFCGLRLRWLQDGCILLRFVVPQKHDKDCE